MNAMHISRCPFVVIHIRIFGNNAFSRCQYLAVVMPKVAHIPSVSIQVYTVGKSPPKICIGPHIRCAGGQSFLGCRWTLNDP